MRSPEEAALVGLGHGGVEDVGLQLVLAADEDEALVGAGGDRADDAALDQQVRVLLHQQAVLEGARLGLVRVAAEVLVHRALGDEAGLLAHREAGAAAAAQPRLLELVQHLLGAHLRQRLAQRAVAAEPLVDRDRVQVRLVDVGQQHAGLVHRSSSPSRDGGASLVPGRAAPAGPARPRPGRPREARRAARRPSRCRRRGARRGPPARRPAGRWWTGGCTRDRAARAPAAPPRPPSWRARSRRRRTPSSGPTKRPFTEAIGAMSHAPRHSNSRTSTSSRPWSAACSATAS